MQFFSPRILSGKIRLGWMLNPFHLYCISFLVIILLYQLNWCLLYPPLSVSLIIFFCLSFILFFLIGIRFKVKLDTVGDSFPTELFNNLMFITICFLWIANVGLMGYIPIFDRTHDYKEYGISVIDPLFNTLSIYLASSYSYTYLRTRRKKMLVLVSIIIVLQLLLLRRASIAWILTSISFTSVIIYKKISIRSLLIIVILIPVFSFLFGFLGNFRSNFKKDEIFTNLGASTWYKNSNLSHNHYMTYIYLTSPLANLQKNINNVDRLAGKGEYVDFVEYCILPNSVILRLERNNLITPPQIQLVYPYLIVGTLFMTATATLGWVGLLIMMLLLLIFIYFSLYISKKSIEFHIPTVSLLLTTVSLSFFTNFLNRSDIILILFCYPLIFHILNAWIVKKYNIG
jgi:oligosaccharide repeat unit polymerase